MTKSETFNGVQLLSEPVVLRGPRPVMIQNQGQQLRIFCVWGKFKANLTIKSLYCIYTIHFFLKYLINNRNRLHQFIQTLIGETLATLLTVTSTFLFLFFKDSVLHFEVRRTLQKKSFALYATNIWQTISFTLFSTEDDNIWIKLTTSQQLSSLHQTSVTTTLVTAF